MSNVKSNAAPSGYNIRKVLSDIHRVEKGKRQAGQSKVDCMSTTHIDSDPELYNRFNQLVSKQGYISGYKLG
jgi:hypothetical protein